MKPVFQLPVNGSRQRLKVTQMSRADTPSIRGNINNWANSSSNREGDFARELAIFQLPQITRRILHLFDLDRKYNHSL
uniref:Uncharacterized protein n=1 Tax=Arundo donax TaxID=35708 RepID=A0A0A9DKW1_ARUDO